MRIIPFAISAIATAALVFVFNSKKVLPAPLGKLLSPQHGIWQNAEPANADFNADLHFPQLAGKTEVYFDERLVPHIFAEQATDAYFVQGYLHAKFRLWQMEFQTLAAAGRVSEVIGDKAIQFDREQRRMGMMYGAESALKEMEKNEDSKKVYDAYTAGVNAYINTLTESELPIEYKLLGYKPEPWNNLKIALLLKQMTKTLAGFDNDFEMTNAKSLFTETELKLLYPQVNEGLEPIIPKGTVFDTAGIKPIKPATADSLYFNYKKSITDVQISKPDSTNGSNNWAVSGKKTKSGAPILCNDPHLELSFPSIWYEIQINVPGSNAYGVSLPGSPAVIIGFNDSIAWGVTNAQRDVKDYYEIKFKDDTKKEYWFNKSWQQTNIKIEEIKIKDKPSLYDTVAYTVFGPVMFDKSFSNDGSKNRNLALRWVGHDASDDGNTFYKLNYAKNYDDYLNAIKTFTCPGQNFLFASKTGDIAIWQQAKFPARWNNQGTFIMPGEDSSYMWQGFIPQAENPHAMNPERGFLSSANQRPVDSTYPYFIPGQYIPERGIAITEKLSAMNQITPQDMMQLQNNYDNIFAARFKPILLKYVRENDLNADAKKYLDIFKNWDLQNGPSSTGATVFKTWFDSLFTNTFNDELFRTTPHAPYPKQLTFYEDIQHDSAFKFFDNINTPAVETIFDQVTTSLQKASVALAAEEKAGKLEWSKHKNATVYHILKTAMLPFARTGLPVGGGGDIINATTHSHGPSWRMIVHLTNTTEAYAVYPGGQSGNPGSKYYDMFVDTWATGKYYTLWPMKASDKTDKKVKWVMKFNKA